MTMIKKRTIVHLISGLNRAGAESVLTRLVLNDHYYTHVVVSMTGKGDLGAELEQNGVKLVCLNFKKSRINFEGILKFYRLLNNEEVLCLQTWMYHADFLGGIIGKFVRCKVFWNLRHSNFSLRDDKLLTFVIMCINALLSHFIPKKIICCAHASKASHSKMGYSSRKMVVIENGIDIGKYRPSNETRIKFRKYNNISMKGFTIGFVARFSAQKDFETFFSAFSKFQKDVPDSFCVMAGAGVEPSNPEYSALSEKYQITDNILALGKLDMVHQMMQSVDLLVLSSSHGEGYPNVLIEAMACGAPVIATNVGDSRHIVNNYGWIVEPKNPDILKDAMLQSYKAYRDEDAWKILTSQVRELVFERNNCSIMVKNYQKVWSG